MAMPDTTRAEILVGYLEHLLHGIGDALQKVADASPAQSDIAGVADTGLRQYHMATEYLAELDRAIQCTPTGALRSHAMFGDRPH